MTDAEELRKLLGQFSSLTEFEQSKHNSLEPLIPLYPYQEYGVDFLHNNKRVILADDMGLGKTAQAICAAEKLYCKRILIVCPATLKNIWYNEIKKWVGEESIENVNSPNFTIREQMIKNKAKYTIINYEMLGERIKRLKDTREIINKDGTFADAPYIITDYNKLTLQEEGVIKIDERHLPTLKNIKWDMIICDEAHRVKNRNTSSFKALEKIVHDTECPNLFLLTGTPILNRVDELWTLLNLIDKDKYSSFWRFDREFSYYPSELKKELEPILLRRLKKDVLTDLPDKQIINYDVVFDSWQHKKYNQMESEMCMETGDGNIIDAVSFLAQLIRLKQIAVSPDLLNPTTDELRGAKIDSLLEIIEDSGDNKIVIFSQFSTVIRRLKKKLISLGYKTAGFTGSDNNKDFRENEINRFQTDDECKIFLTTIKAGGLGITLTAANIAIFTDLEWTPALNAQASDRLHRIGQKDNVTVYNLTARHTIEEYILQVLAEKDALFNSAIPVEEVRQAAIAGWKNSR